MSFKKGHTAAFVNRDPVEMLCAVVSAQFLTYVCGDLYDFGFTCKQWVTLVLVHACLEPMFAHIWLFRQIRFSCDYAF